MPKHYRVTVHRMDGTEEGFDDVIASLHLSWSDDGLRFGDQWGKIRDIPVEEIAAVTLEVLAPPEPVKA